MKEVSIMNEIDYILSNVSLVTDNIKLKNYIKKSIIDNKGKLRINVVSSKGCNFAFKNSDNEHVYINILNNSIYVYVNNCHGYEEVNYSHDDCGKSIVFNSIMVDDDLCFENVVNILEEINYDLNNVMVSHKCYERKETLMNGEYVKNLLCSNYDMYTEDYIIDGEIFRVQDLNYHYLSDMNRRQYYVSDYKDGMLSSGNSKKCIEPRFVSFHGDVSNYESKINVIKRKNAQKQKIML